MRFKTPLILILSVFSISLCASEDWVFVKSIQLIGNKKTKDRVIYRELDFNVGDSLLVNEIGKRFEQNRLFILNTGMFNEVKLNIKTWDQTTNEISIDIELTEGWYIYPVPVFELADRDFNVWWKEFGLSLKRLNLGVRFYHLNMTGNRDRLKLAFQFGFSQKYEIRYNFPGFNKAQTLGLTANVFYGRTKELGYITEGNRLLFYRSEDDYMRFRRRAGLTFSYRPGRLSYHYLKLEYQHNNIHEYVASELNSNYFPEGALSQKLMFLQYEFVYDNRDIRPYPMKGNQLYVSFKKEGLGLFKDRDGMYVEAHYDQYLSFTEKLSVALATKGKLALRRDFQPYNNFSALGYNGDFLRGYELYVIDGLDYLYFKSTFRWRIFNRQFNLGRAMPIKSFKVMPIKIFLTLHNDSGYVNDPQYGEINPLGNQWLWGGGVGIHMVLYYDKVFRIEYSFNELGERGLFLQYKLSL